MGKWRYQPSLQALVRRSAFRLRATLRRMIPSPKISPYSRSSILCSSPTSAEHSRLPQQRPASLFLLRPPFPLRLSHVLPAPVSRLIAVTVPAVMGAVRLWARRDSWRFANVTSLAGVRFAARITDSIHEAAIPHVRRQRRIAVRKAYKEGLTESSSTESKLMVSLLSAGHYYLISASLARIR